MSSIPVLLFGRECIVLHHLLSLGDATHKKRCSFNGKKQKTHFSSSRSLVESDTTRRTLRETCTRNTHNKRTKLTSTKQLQVPNNARLARLFPERSPSAFRLRGQKETRLGTPKHPSAQKKERKKQPRDTKRQKDPKHENLSYLSMPPAAAEQQRK